MNKALSKWFLIITYATTLILAAFESSMEVSVADGLYGLLGLFMFTVPTWLAIRILTNKN